MVGILEAEELEDALQKQEMMMMMIMMIICLLNIDDLKEGREGGTNE